MDNFVSAVSTLYRQSRYDAPNCSPGNKPCGDVCIPQRYRCKTTGGSRTSPQRKKMSTAKKMGALALAGTGAVGLIRGAGKMIADRRKGGKKSSGTDWDGLVKQSEETLNRATKKTKELEENAKQVREKIKNSTNPGPEYEEANKMLDPLEERMKSGDLTKEEADEIDSIMEDFMKETNKNKKNDSLRHDAVNCKPGNKPCGRTCIPQRNTCRGSAPGGGRTSHRKRALQAVGVAAGVGGTLGLAKFANGVVGKAMDKRRRQKIAEEVAASQAK